MDLYSDRLRYVKFAKDDFADYLRWYTDDVVMKYITGRALTLEEATKRFKAALLINNEHADAGLYAARDRHTNAFIGIAKFVFNTPEEVEVGYGMLPPYWGRGYASEILGFLIQHARRHDGVDTLMAIVSPGNLPSKRVLEKYEFVWYKEDLKIDNPAEYYKLALA